MAASTLETPLYKNLKYRFFFIGGLVIVSGVLAIFALQKDPSTSLQINYEKRKFVGIIDKNNDPQLARLPDNISGGMYYPFGIDNPGVHCYFISILQCFAALYDHLEVTDAIGDWGNPNLIPFNNFLAFLRVLRRGKPNSSLSDESIYSLFHKINPDLFHLPMQQDDAISVYRFLFNLSSELKWHKNFEIPMETIYTCNENHKSNLNVFIESFSLPFPEPLNPKKVLHLEDLLLNYFNDVTLERNCHACALKSANEKRIMKNHLPPVLSINLLRGLFDKKKKIITKIFNPVIIPEFFEPIRGERFRLTGISFHSGLTINSGHYIALVRYNNNWFLCNDSLVTLSSLDIIKEGNYNSFTPYMLFYTKL
jgi:ubiquitin C-terminal hydrolase